MSAYLLASLILVLLATKSIADPYVRSDYTCPSCGTKRQGSHAHDCPWQRR